MSRILVVDDEPAIRESVAYALRRDGFEPAEAGSLKEAERLFGEADLIILDLMLPDGSGVEFLRALRATSRVPVIILTSRDEESDRVVGLELGADDYVVKPFSPRELVARVRAVLRRSQAPLAAAEVGPLSGPDGMRLDPEARRAQVRNAELDLSKTEFDLLAALMRAPGRVFTRGQLLDQVWGAETVVGDRTVDVHVKTLRKKLEQAGADPFTIETVRGVGYRLREDGR